MNYIGISSLEGLEGVILKNVEVNYLFKPKKEINLKELISLKIPGDDQKFQISQFSIQKD
jgi:hypothetical protein